MFRVDEWMSCLREQLLLTFNERLIYIGLQGSYRRNEAKDSSDIDVMVVLDYLSVDDLKIYKNIISNMNDPEKACGFICGAGELKSWPKHEIFLLVHETKDYYGNLKPYPLWVLGEESALERIFLNLFQNAGRYADTYFHISIKECKQNIYILFINDTRILSKDDTPHLFERFYMKDSSRYQGGTGLGLTVAKSLAEEMGAKLDAYIINNESTSPKSETCKICFELCMKVI